MRRETDICRIVKPSTAAANAARCLFGFFVDTCFEEARERVCLRAAPVLRFCCAIHDDRFHAARLFSFAVRRYARPACSSIGSNAFGVGGSACGGESNLRHATCIHSD